MSNSTTVKRVKAKSLGSALRRQLRLAPEEEIDVTVKKRTEATTKRREKDPWKEIKGILSHAEAEEMRQVIATSRRSQTEAPDVGEP